MSTTVARIMWCCLGLVLSACATIANTPQQNLAYERWAKCISPDAQLQGIDVNGRITFVISAPSARREVSQCLAEAGRSGPALPAPVAILPQGGP